MQNVKFLFFSTIFIFSNSIESIHLDIVCDVDIESWKELIFNCTDLM
jgi:hypothetical protein